MHIGRQHLAHQFVVRTRHFFRRAEGALRRFFKKVNFAGNSVIDPAKFRPITKRPIAGRGMNSEHSFQFVEQGERCAGRAVELVDEGENRHPAATADFEKLSGLRLDAFGRVDDHDRGVDGREHPVGVLGEILVAGRVEQVDHITVVVELQDGGGDRDAALLFQFHPIARGGPLVAARGDTAGQLHRPAVKEELFGQRGLARVRMRNDGKGAPPRGFADCLFVCVVVTHFSAVRGGTGTGHPPPRLSAPVRNIARSAPCRAGNFAAAVLYGVFGGNRPPLQVVDRAVPARYF